MKTCVLRVKIDKKNLKNYLLPKCPSDIRKEVTYKIRFIYTKNCNSIRNAYKNKPVETNLYTNDAIN